MSLIAQNLSIGFTKNRNQVVLQENIGFKLDTKDIVLLAGPNGIGKSVFLKTLIGMLPALSGTLSFNNEIIPLNANKPNKWMSFMLATPPKVELLNPLDIVLSAKKHSHSWLPFKQNDTENALKSLHFSGVEHLKYRPFNELSDGEKQKVMLARCLYQETPVVLLDEPTAFLDHPSKIDFWERIKSHSEAHNTRFIVCTHDLHISLPHVSQVWLMQKKSFQKFENPKDFHVEMI